MSLSSWFKLFQNRNIQVLESKSFPVFSKVAYVFGNYQSFRNLFNKGKFQIPLEAMI